MFDKLLSRSSAVKSNMAPNQNGMIAKSTNDESETTTLVNRSDRMIKDRPNKRPYEMKPGEKPYKLEIVWRNVIAFLYLHYGAVYAFTLTPKFSTIAIGVLFGLIGSYGISSGSHRLWAHKCYKANKKMKAMLLFFQTIAFQNSVIEWVRDHRVHHKFSDTNADPHNASRGFFFSHMGWLMCKKHPDVRKYGSRVDMSDLEADPWLRFQHKYYLILVPLISFGLPVFISSYFFGDSVITAYYFNLFRYVLTLHITWSINSVSHIWGSKPFEKDIAPTDTYIIGFLAFGEGWHNYHHVYPWDYKVSELPRYWCNFSIPFLDFFAWLGWATDLKTVSDEMIRKRVMRTGDGSHRYAKKEVQAKTARELLDTFNNNNNHEEEEHVDTLWGWGDDDMDAEEKKDVKILHPKFGA